MSKADLWICDDLDVQSAAFAGGAGQVSRGGRGCGSLLENDCMRERGQLHLENKPLPLRFLLLLQAME